MCCQDRAVQISGHPAAFLEICNLPRIVFSSFQTIASQLAAKCSDLLPIFCCSAFDFLNQSLICCARIERISRIELYSGGTAFGRFLYALDYSYAKPVGQCSNLKHNASNQISSILTQRPSLAERTTASHTSISLSPSSKLANSPPSVLPSSIAL